jgi:hypothetical protein
MIEMPKIEAILYKSPTLSLPTMLSMNVEFTYAVIARCIEKKKENA